MDEELEVVAVIADYGERGKKVRLVEDMPDDGPADWWLEKDHVTPLVRLSDVRKDAGDVDG